MTTRHLVRLSTRLLSTSQAPDIKLDEIHEMFAYACKCNFLHHYDACAMPSSGNNSIASSQWSTIICIIIAIMDLLQVGMQADESKIAMWFLLLVQMLLPLP